MYWRIAAVAVTCLVLAGAGWKCYVMGKQSVQTKWDAERAASALAAVESFKKQQEVADSVAKTVVESARKDRIVYRTLTKEVDRVSNDCPASSAFGMLHDAAATASMPDSSSTGVNGSTIAAKDVAETVIENYESCRDSNRRLEALQAIIRQYNKEVP
jgi:hypothetical protein